MLGTAGSWGGWAVAAASLLLTAWCGQQRAEALRALVRVPCCYDSDPPPAASPLPTTGLAVTACTAGVAWLCARLVTDRTGLAATACWAAHRSAAGRLLLAVCAACCRPHGGCHARRLRWLPTARRSPTASRRRRGARRLSARSASCSGRRTRRVPGWSTRWCRSRTHSRASWTVPARRASRASAPTRGYGWSLTRASASTASKGWLRCAVSMLPGVAATVVVAAASAGAAP
jgi:hypothetical protein